jgi:hypothetical protein
MVNQALTTFEGWVGRAVFISEAWRYTATWLTGAFNPSKATPGETAGALIGISAIDAD